MITRTSTSPTFRPLAALAFFCCAAFAAAQQMPQDNWRYDGLQFSSPTATNFLRSVAIGTGGVYVGEATASGTATKIIQFTEGGVFVRRFSATFTYILGIACDPVGNVYVLDRGDSKVKVYTQDGVVVQDAGVNREWGGSGTADGKFNFATYTYLGLITVGKNGQVYVCDPGNNRVQVFSNQGAFVRKWGQLGSLPSQFTSGTPHSISWSPNGELYVGSGTPYFRVFAEDGTYLRSGNPVNSSYSHGMTPDGLLLSSDGSNDIYVLDPDFSTIAYYAFTNNAFGGFGVGSRGDLYAISSDLKSIRVYEREYSNVQNSLLPPAIPQPIVLSAVQRVGTSLMDIDYQVTDADSPTITTGALAFKDGGNTLSNAIVMNTFLEGTGVNIGAAQPANAARHLTWSMGADWSVDFAQVQVEILAKDSRNLLGIHWITVPASGPDPAVQVSSAPITDARLMDLWYWFLATHNAGVGFSNAVVRGTGGLYSGQPLARDIAATVTTTSAGRLFAYEQMGVRPISGSELARAKAGTYGFTSVDNNSVVKVATPVVSFLKAWGNNGEGQANNNSPSSAGVTQVAAGASHSLFLNSDGAVWAMGNNDYGQLGDGTVTSRISPVLIATGVAQVAAGGGHSLLLKTDGTLWAMGYNGYGQLGDTTTTSRSIPVQVAADVVRIAAGGNHSLFVKATNSALCAMGYNAYGQLGDGTTTSRSTPAQIVTGVSQIAAGGNHSLFVKTTNSALWAMGYNGLGELGDGTTTSRSTPVQITTGVVQVAAGANHSLFVKTTNGALLATGYNNVGQLGDGTTVNRSTPVQVATDVSLVAAGGSHSLFVKTNKTLSAMGENGSGQLGDGTTTDRSTPIQVDVNVTAIAAGSSHSLAVITAP